jgi:hypothetical protein
MTGAPAEQTPAEACKEIETEMPALATLLRRPCLDMLAANGAGIQTAMTRDVPRMLFIFPPLLAGFQHTHAALFAALVTVMIVGWLGQLVHWVAVVAGNLGLAVLVYATWYICRAVRRVYGQSRRRTLARLNLLAVAYGTCLVLML